MLEPFRNKGRIQRSDTIWFVDLFLYFLVVVVVRLLRGRILMVVGRRSILIATATSSSGTSSSGTTVGDYLLIMINGVHKVRLASMRGTVELDLLRCGDTPLKFPPDMLLFHPAMKG